MVRQSFTLLLVSSLFGFASCGTTQLGAARHKESVPSTVLMAVTSVEVSTHLEADLDGMSSSNWNDVGAWGIDRGPLDLTTPTFMPSAEVIVDMGIGEAPYDDGFLDYALDYSPLVGFSVSIMQLEYRARVQPGVSVFGIAAMNRIQDETIMHAMNENDWAWVSVGVQLSW